MANSSAKKLYKSNQQRLKALAAAIVVTNLLFAIIRGGFFYTYFDRFYIIITCFLAFIYSLSFYVIWVSARPTFSDSGALIDAGNDITQGGVLEYVHDLIYISLFVQLGLIFTKWASLIFLTIPLYVGYLAFGFGFSPFGSEDNNTSSEDTVDQLAGLSRREKRKAERQARKQK